MTVTFCGHGEMNITPALREWLRAQVIAQIEAGAGLFYLGGYGDFDRLAADVVWELKKEYPGIAAVLVLPYLDKKVSTAHYDGTVYPPLEKVPRRYAIVRRNRWMVDASDVVIAAVRHGWGGAAQTLQYARTKQKTVIYFPAWEP